MQRASAASPATSIPRPVGAQTPATEPPVKRRRIESSTTSPSISVPGTPTIDSANGLVTPTPTTVRGGVSTFTRVGADTEWVLEMKPPSRESALRSTENSSHNFKPSGPNGSASRFTALADQDDEIEDMSGEEEDIWNTAQPSGRQTFGSFKKQKSRKPTQQNQPPDDNEEDLSSASGSDDDSDSDNGSDEKPGLDSDEEMRRAARSMEKHRSMEGGGFGGRPGQNAFSNRGQSGGKRPFDNGQRGQKRKGREQGSYKQKKKAKNSRKTI